MIVTKALDLALLEAELDAAGVTHRGLGVTATDDGLDLHTYAANGTVEALPAGATAVVTAHTAPPPPTPANYGNDATDIDRQAAQAATQLRAFIANGAPTNAEVIASVKLQSRILLALMRRAGL